AGIEPLDAGSATSLWRPPMARRAGTYAAASDTSSRARTRRWRGVVLAIDRGPCCRSCRRPGAPTGALRSGRLGSKALRDAVGVGLPLRGVYANPEAEARIL